MARDLDVPLVRCRHADLDAEADLPASALDYLDGWAPVDLADVPPTAAEASAPSAPDAGTSTEPVSPAQPGSTPVGRPTRTKES